MKWIVYQTINTVNNKIYVGVHKTENPDVFDGYIGCGVIVTNPSSYMRKQTPFHCAVAKYGPSKFIRTILKIFDSGKEAYKLEEEIVNADFIKREDTYNARVGGEGGKMLRTVYQFDLNGVLIKEWNTMQDIADFYFTSHTAVMHAIHLKHGYQNYFWSLEPTINIDEYTNYVSGTVIYKYDGTTGKFVDSYNSMTIAAQENGILIQQIQSAVKGGYLADGNYYSKELHEIYKGDTKISIKNKPLYVYTLDGEFVKELNGSTEICEFLEAKFINAVTAAMRQHRPYKNYQLSLEKVESMPAVINKRNEKKKIARYDLAGNLLETYPSITSAVNAYGTGVQRVLKGQQKHCHNFIFKYI